MIDYQLSEQLSPYLDPSERIRWVGKPKEGIRFQPSDVYLIPFSLLWAGFAFYWEWMVFKHGGPHFFLLFGGFFVLMGIYIVVGRFVHDAFRRASTVYAVTDKRVVVLVKFFSKSLKSFDLRSLTNISVNEGSNGFGDVLLGPGSSNRWVGGSGWPGSRDRQAPALEWIPDARSVFNTISEARAELMHE